MRQASPCSSLWRLKLLALPLSSEIELRRGRLNLDQLIELIAHRGITGLVDAAHPFAVKDHRTAEQPAEKSTILYLLWLREESELTPHPSIHSAPNHECAAQISSGLLRPILLTIGSRNVLPYALAARSRELPVFARVLLGEESEEACRNAGLRAAEIIHARGPFTVEDAYCELRKFAIGTLVTKESGRAGGVPEEVEAAIHAHCDVVIMQRTRLPNEISIAHLGSNQCAHRLSPHSGSDVTNGIPEISMNATLLLGAALGMRHGTEPDHLAAIDGLTRIRPRSTNGVLFALGHGLVVMILSVGIGHVIAGRLAFLGPWTLILIGTVNAIRLLRGGKATPPSPKIPTAQHYDRAVVRAEMTRRLRRYVVRNSCERVPS